MMVKKRIGHGNGINVGGRGDSTRIKYGGYDVSMWSHNNGLEGQCKVDMNGELLAFAFLLHVVFGSGCLEFDESYCVLS
jgi:hypothetical protein